MGLTIGNLYWVYRPVSREPERVTLLEFRDTAMCVVERLYGDKSTWLVPVMALYECLDHISQVPATDWLAFEAEKVHVKPGAGNNTVKMPLKLRGKPVLAFVQTETQSTGPCGYILVQKDKDDYVTAWYRVGDSEWAHGYYTDDIDAAYTDLFNRVQNASRFRSSLNDVRPSLVERMRERAPNVVIPPDAD